MTPSTDAAIDATVERLRLELRRLYTQEPEQGELSTRLLDAVEVFQAVGNVPAREAFAALHLAARALRLIIERYPHYTAAWQEDLELADLCPGCPRLHKLAA